MREDIFDVGRPGEGVAIMELGNRPRRIGGKVDQRVRETKAVGGRIGRYGRVHEHQGLASLELVEQRPEPWIAKIDATGVGKEDDPVELQRVEAIFELRERAVEVRERKRRIAAE